MSKRLPFEETFRRKMNELPLPDESKAWKKMKQLLDEKEKRRSFVFYRTEKIIGSVLLLLLLSFWLIIAPEKTRQPDVNKDIVKKETNDQHPTKERTVMHLSTLHKISKRNDSLANLSLLERAQTSHTKMLSHKSYLITKNSSKDLSDKSFGVQNKKLKLSALNNGELTVLLYPEKEERHIKSYSNKALQQDSASYSNSKPAIHDSAETLVSIKRKDSSSLSESNDSSHDKLTGKDNLQQINSNRLAISSMKKNAITLKKRNSYFIDAGIGLKQQLPINGQRIVSYNYNGTATLLTDYIPSVYMKLEKDKRWFLQAEFNYSSPRLIREFTYWQQTKADYVHANTTITESRLQKTFYSELPASFNVYVRSSWSAGAGMMYSWLRGAVASKEVTTNAAQPGMQKGAEERMPLKGFKDSFLYRTQASLLLQTTYEKNRWLFGLRCLQDVQPFITYTLPAGEKSSKKNSSLEVMIQYRLFRSSKFRLIRQQPK